MKMLRSFWLWVLLLIVVFTFGLITHNHLVQAGTAPPSWLDPNIPTLTKLSDLPVGQFVPYSINGNRDCQQRKIITRAAKILPVWPYLQSELSSDGCTVDTAFGAVDLNNNLQRPGSSVFGRILNSAGGPGNIIGVPHSTTALQYESAPIGLNFKFIPEFEQYVNSAALSTGETTHKIVGTPGTYMQDKSGKKLTGHPDSLSFSADGDWMLIDLPSIGLARVDLHTFEVLPFGEPINYVLGLTPSLQTAISSDGRYAVESSVAFNIFRLFDLSTCASAPNTITARVSCQSVNLLPFMQQKVPGFFGVGTLRFHGDYALDLYVTTRLNGVVSRSHQVLTAAGQSDTGFQYLGLGDSFASGEGAFNYKTITDVAKNKCHLSEKSYPYLIASALNYDQYESVACSGAIIEDIERIDDKYKGQVHDGLELLDRDLDSIITAFNPGYVGQKEFARRKKPKIITISAVGNDIGFSDIIHRCVDTDTCYSTYEDRLELLNSINNQFYRATDMYKQLKEAAGPTTKIYVIGYPGLVYAEGNCAANVHLNHNELVFAGQLISYLNEMIKTAAANQGVFYVDMEHSLDGNRLCETDSWNVAVNGLTAGNDAPSFLNGPIGNESFHPNAFGHELFKNTILEKTNYFTAPMPEPNPTLAMAAPSNTLPILQVSKTNRPIKIIRNVTGTNGGVIETGKTMFMRYTPAGWTIKAGSKVKAWLHSDPYYLGEFPVNSDGTIDVSFTLPDSIPNGIHTLHLYGQNTGDEDMDLYQIVYVSDGNTTSCGVVAASGQDTDKDGIDDACDSFIDQAPLPTPEPEPVPTTPEPPIEVINDTPPELPPIDDTTTPEDPLPVVNDIPPDLPPVDDSEDPSSIEVVNEPPASNETGEQTGETVTENPQDTVTPEPTVDTPQDPTTPQTSETIGDAPAPKPPQNNSETVAGNEELHESTNTRTTPPETHTQTRNNVLQQYISLPSAVAGLSSDITTPLQTTKDIAVSKATELTHNKLNLHLTVTIPIGIIITLLIIFAIKLFI